MRESSQSPRNEELKQVVACQLAICFSISFQHPFNRAGGRTSNVGFIGIPHLVWAFAALIGIAFIFVLALVSSTPRPICPRCNARMKRRYSMRSRGPSDDLFLVFDHCKVYADADPFPQGFPLERSRQPGRSGIERSGVVASPSFWSQSFLPFLNHQQLKREPSQRIV